jgi:very-short-patch-repair endonuclease
MANGSKEKILPAFMEGQKRAAQAKLGTKCPKTSLRMKKNNPMRNPESREKMQKSLTGRTFLARGGNSKITPQQQAVHEATGYPMELSINTREVRHLFQSVPKSYKVDLADESRKLAIEIDGKTHKTNRWKFLDSRKTEILGALGWSVLRFWNEEVTEDLPRVLKEIASFTAYP